MGQESTGGHIHSDRGHDHAGGAHGGGAERPAGGRPGEHGGHGAHGTPGGHGAHGGHGGKGHDHHAEALAAPTRVLGFTLGITLLYALVEAGVGFWARSLSLLADAGHMITDSGALVVSLLVARIASRPRSMRKTYGYRRAEVIGALANAAAMLVISCVIMVEAVQRIAAPQLVHGESLFITATGGLLVNVVAALVLSRAAGNMNVRSALLHVWGDALGSVGAIVAGLCVTYLGFMLADPLASAAISIVLGVGSIRLLREASDVLMESTPTDLDIRALERTILETPGVQAVHDLHVWCLTPREPMLTAHVVLKPSAHGTDVAKRVGDRLSAAHGLDHVTIQPEPPAPELIPIRIRTPQKKL